MIFRNCYMIEEEDTHNRRFIWFGIDKEKKERYAVMHKVEDDHITEIKTIRGDKATDLYNRLIRESKSSDSFAEMTLYKKVIDGKNYCFTLEGVEPND